VLTVAGLRAGYQASSEVLRGFDLAVAEGETVALMGRNGMGKSTLLRAIMGHLRIAAGRIRFLEHEIVGLRPFEISNLGIAYVPQGREIFSQLTVEENLRIGFDARRGAKLREIPEHIFEWFPVLKKMLRRRGGDLSGGQQQQLAIGRAMVLDPKLLILDEPAEGIQPNIVHEIGDIILRLNREARLTVLLVEQKLPFARRVASEFRILDKGRVVSSGDIAALSDDLVRQHLTV
jgi:urea transport system ATP-binding protein